MAAHAHDIGRLPRVRQAVGEGELHGQRPLAGANLGHIDVDAGDEGLGAGPGLRTVGGPFGVHVAAIEEEACGAVLFGVGGAEAGGEQAEAALAPEIDLPEAVTGGVVALDEEGVVFGGGADVGDSPLVDQDPGRRLQAGDLRCLYTDGG